MESDEIQVLLTSIQEQLVQLNANVIDLEQLMFFGFTMVIGAIAAFVFWRVVFPE